MSNKVGLIFDLDYTLIENKFYPWIYEYILSSIGAKNMSADEFRTFFFNNFREWIGQGRYIEAFDWDKLLEYTLKKLGYEPKVTFTEAFIENFRSGRARVFEGVKGFLEKVKNKGHVVGIISNGVWRFQKITLNLTSLSSLVDFVVTSDYANAIKPFKRIFDLGKKECVNRGASKIIFFGDSLLFDVVGSIVYGYDEVFWLTDETTCFEKKTLRAFKAKVEIEMERYGIRVEVGDKWDKEIYLYKSYDCLNRYFFSLNLI